MVAICLTNPCFLAVAVTISLFLCFIVFKNFNHHLISAEPPELEQNFEEFGLQPAQSLAQA
jgi:hypothetical protein